MSEVWGGVHQTFNSPNPIRPNYQNIFWKILFTPPFFLFTPPLRHTFNLHPLFSYLHPLLMFHLNSFYKYYKSQRFHLNYSLLVSQVLELWPALLQVLHFLPVAYSNKDLSRVKEFLFIAPAGLPRLLTTITGSCTGLLAVVMTSCNQVNKLAVLGPSE